MTEQEFADMFERYAKTPRGIKFLTGYVKTMFKHCVIEHEENECFGVQHTMDFYDIENLMADDFELEELMKVKNDCS